MGARGPVRRTQVRALRRGREFAAGRLSPGIDRLGSCPGRFGPEFVGKAKHVADLFAGLGTFTFALAASASVDAFETTKQRLPRLPRRARNVRPEADQDASRDLFGSPLGPKELRRYDAVVFDPPRAGAASQAEMLAKSEVPKLVAISCNPGTLARDLRILVDGGYRITRVVPVDQFLFSPHIEVVAELER